MASLDSSSWCLGVRQLSRFSFLVLLRSHLKFKGHLVRTKCRYKAGGCDLPCLQKIFSNPKNDLKTGDASLIFATTRRDWCRKKLERWKSQTWQGSTVCYFFVASRTAMDVVFCHHSCSIHGFRKQMKTTNFLPSFLQNHFKFFFSAQIRLTHFGYFGLTPPCLPIGMFRSEIGVNKDLLVVSCSLLSFLLMMSVSLFNSRRRKTPTQKQHFATNWMGTSATKWALWKIHV